MKQVYIVPQISVEPIHIGHCANVSLTGNNSAGSMDVVTTTSQIFNASDFQPNN